MKSNCCQANVLLVDKHERTYKCIDCRQIFTPSAKENYMAGIVEGMKIIREEMQTDMAENGRHYNVKAIITFLASMDKRIGRLIKQYSGDE